MSAMEVDLEDKKKAVEDAKEEEPDVVDPLREALGLSPQAPEPADAEEEVVGVA